MAKNTGSEGVKKTARTPAAPLIVIVICLLVPALNFGLSSDSRVEEGMNLRRWAMEFGLGAAVPTENDLGSGFSYGLSVPKRFTIKLGVEVFLGRDSLSVEDGFAGLEAGRLDYTALLLNGYLFIPVKGRILPYAFIGVGFYFYDYKPNTSPDNPDKGVVDRFALNFGAGMDYMISNRVALTARARYNLPKTWVEDLPRQVPIGSVDPREQDIIHIFTLGLTVGLKYCF
jgi:opacity protein-like surface antigen